MNIIQPYFIKKIKDLINKGYKLTNILEEYNENGIFMDEIIANYYHVNNGPDLLNYQIEAIEEAIKVFIDDNNYKLFWCCGLGKTKTSLSIAKRLNFSNILIAVPSILLLDQFAEDIKNFYPLTSIFKYYSKGKEKKKLSDNLSDYLKTIKRYKIVLTTYHSSEKILQIVNNLNFQFDFVILDEAHHLHSKDSKLFSSILDIPFKKRILLTATPYIGKETKKVFSLESTSIFKGKNNTKSVSWAIKNNYITNYNIIILNLEITTLDNDLIDVNKIYNRELVLAAYMALKCIFNDISKKIIIYCNKVASAKYTQEIINILLKNHSNNSKLFNTLNKRINIGNYELNGEDNQEKRVITLNAFKDIEYGIMCSVQLFGEGYDYPELDSVLFAEKMSSDIRIVQSGLRPCRKDKNNPNKIANILLPSYDNNFDKLKQVIIKMKSVDNIIDKIQIVDKNSINSINSINSKLLINNSKNSYIHVNNKFNLTDINKRLLEQIKLEYLKEDLNFIEINNKNLTNSKIVSCEIKINNTIISTNKKKYKQILIDLWKTIPSNILLNPTSAKFKSTFKFKQTDENGIKGFNWSKILQLSIQNKDSNNCMKEILHIVKNKNYKLNMAIKLDNKEELIIKI